MREMHRQQAPRIALVALLAVVGAAPGPVGAMIDYEAVIGPVGRDARAATLADDGDLGRLLERGCEEAEGERIREAEADRTRDRGERP